MFDELGTEVRGAHDVNGQVVLALHVTGRSRTAGLPLALDYAVVIELDDEDRVKRGREYATLEEALRAAEST